MRRNGAQAHDWVWTKYAPSTNHGAHEYEDHDFAETAVASENGDAV